MDDASVKASFTASATAARRFASGQAGNTAYLMTEKVASGDRFMHKVPPQPAAALDLTTPPAKPPAPSVTQRRPGVIPAVKDFSL